MSAVGSEATTRSWYRNSASAGSTSTDPPEAFVSNSRDIAHLHCSTVAHATQRANARVGVVCSVRLARWGAYDGGVFFEKAAAHAISQANALPSSLPAPILPLSWLLGVWRGRGVGGYTEHDSFEFLQEAVFTTDGRPFLHYHSRTTRLLADGAQGEQLASETGYLRPAPDNAVEMLLAHPTGYVEIWVGDVTVTGLVDAKITGARMELRTAGLLRTETAKDYSGGTRMYGLVGEKLMWVMDMKALGHPLASHVSAELERVTAL